MGRIFESILLERIYEYEKYLIQEKRKKSKVNIHYFEGIMDLSLTSYMILSNLEIVTLLCESFFKYVKWEE